MEAWTLDGPVGTVTSTLFETTIDLDNTDGSPDDYVDACVTPFNTLPEATLDHLCEASVRYRNGYLSATGERPRTFATPHDVLVLIRPWALIVPSPENRAFPEQTVEPNVHLESGCSWDVEHGVEWLVRGERVLYVGPCGEADPWGTHVQGGYE